MNNEELPQVEFFGVPHDKLASLLAEDYGCAPFRARQLFRWCYQKGVDDPFAMTDMAKELRMTLAARLLFDPLPCLKEAHSVDGTRKYLFRVPARVKRLALVGEDPAADRVDAGVAASGDLIESVLIKQPDRFTLCVSSQVGCAMGCKFCRTATLGLKRNLTASEIVRQVVQVHRTAALRGETFHNIVFMGMGEPLHNLDNVHTALEILTDPAGLDFSPRRITVSTVGLVPRIEEFFARGTKASLAVSLNGTTDEVRGEIMPVNRKFTLELLVKTLRKAPLKPRDRITLEYVMLNGINDTEADLRRLPKLLRGIRCKVNLIPYNENAGLGFRTPDSRWVEHWARALRADGVSTTVRWSKGQDIDAACGQLAARHDTESIAATA